MATITWVFQNYDYDYNYEIRKSLISRRSVCWQYCFFNLFSFTLSDSKGLYLQSPLFVLQRDLREIITSPFNLLHCSTSSLLLFLVKIRIAAIAIFLENALDGHIWPSISSFPPSLVLLRWGKHLLHFFAPNYIDFSFHLRISQKIKEQIIVVLRKVEYTFVFNTEDLSHSKSFPENS